MPRDGRSATAAHEFLADVESLGQDRHLLRQARGIDGWGRAKERRQSFLKPAGGATGNAGGESRDFLDERAHAGQTLFEDRRG